MYNQFVTNLVYWFSKSETESLWFSLVHLIISFTYLSRESWTARMMTPRMMRVPPREDTTSGRDPVMMAWTEKASTSSTHLRPATRLGEINCRDRVRVVKATSPDSDKPKVMHLHLHIMELCSEVYFDWILYSPNNVSHSIQLVLYILSESMLDVPSERQ